MTPPASQESRISQSLPLVRDSVVTAHDKIASLIHRTPVFTSSSLSASTSGKNTLYFKAENLQKGGAFKFRGASYSLSCLTPEELEKGVCTHSSGEYLDTLLRLRLLVRISRYNGSQMMLSTIGDMDRHPMILGALSHSI